jgi:hypothetical protein
MLSTEAPVMSEIDLSSEPIRRLTPPRQRGAIGRMWHDIIYVVKRERKWWLLPLIVVLLAIAALLVVAALAGPLAPFIYPLL